MDYAKHYNLLIETRKNRIPVKEIYYEKHHIIMRSMGGSNKKENIILLTAREHFIAHWPLWRIHRNKESANAFFSMCRKSKNQQRLISSSIAYSEARGNLKILNSGKNNPRFGVTVSQETRIKLSDKNRKYPLDHPLSSSVFKIIDKNKINPTKPKKILRVNPLTNEQVKYDSISEAARSLKMKRPTAIQFALNGKNKTCKGFIWKYCAAD